MVGQVNDAKVISHNCMRPTCDWVYSIFIKRKKCLHLNTVNIKNKNILIADNKNKKENDVISSVKWEIFS